MTFKHRNKNTESLTKNEIEKKTEEFADKAEKKKLDKQHHEINLSGLSLDNLAEQYVDVDRQSHILKGLILLEARKRFSSNNEFGAWRSLKFNERLTGQMATHLMNLSRFFNDKRPLGNIPISAGYIMSAPKLEDVADIVYERVSEIHKPSLNNVKEIISELKPSTNDNGEDENIDNEILRLNKMTKKQLIDLLVNNITQKQLKKLFIN
ncbi:hypothetical protein bplSymb_SCF02802P001 [Bathymodiolus platifrons methanotrophic gill symbiont]|uniref:hypothetical protein n=1 Tax=Bathymodiolus platifrons methanotrophic gill symbiont TaxID=113268 RepID=UPI000B40B51E|nr:hypothetical protein [Bathymodiolus platifrons methanotrophic gill symbiont]MCK5855598.1 hypothetical protein [Sulfurovaceae bacterium]TXK93094.1 hypothetical protein BMR10_16650 [Methylococcaceae bacterium CS4]TXK94125.1 hypothetical protein BMR11_15735 [Methylococcaceae bacterium CS5]TXK96425.1 hypothetical protein BMR02_11505 [Methylococcaceae bacterium HT1]TXL02628.1 hypothetical protein BMR09_16490 [Methylococcaceae bacterium CS3]TXL03165.1 hypothetical protein BMR08_17405 [Methylococ